MRIRPACLLLALLGFALRALIPVGFMPASDGTLSLTVCPGGFPPQLLRQEGKMADGMGSSTPHPHRGHGLMDDGFCVFSTGFSSAPASLILAAVYLLLAVIVLVAIPMGAPTGIRLVRTPPARAPPIRA